MASVIEKIEFLESIKTRKDYYHLSKRVRGIAFDVASGRTYQYINLRQVLSQKMNQEKIPRRVMARAIGIRHNAFIDYLGGRRNLPYKYVERILGILFGDSDFVDTFVSDDAEKSG